MPSHSESQHIAVLASEVISALALKPGQTVVDGTMGGGGHTRLLAAAVGPTGRVIALDRDPAAVDRAGRELSGLPVHAIQTNYCDLPEVLAGSVLAGMGIERVDGVLLDLGLSSDQLADVDRGFSFHAAGPLDLRFDPTSGEPAWRLIQRLSAEHLADLIFQYGEERYSRRIARKIVERRQKQPIKDAAELASLVRQCVPSRGRQRIDPATRTFQALRIAVNAELESLETALRRFPTCMRAGSKFAIISFHSLEDRRVKEAFRQDARYDIITRKPIRASEQEVQRNPRSRSAKLRVAEILSSTET